MRIPRFAVPIVCLLLGLTAATTITSAQDAESLKVNPVSSRIVDRVDPTRLVRLYGNTHPSARTEFDRGLVDVQKRLDRMILVLTRSVEQDAALAAFNERQYDPTSPDFHHWLHAEEFGQLYGPSDFDIAQVTNWLQNQGFQVNAVGKGKVWIDFSGTVGQVQDTFHLEMHKYFVAGKEHIANDRDPQIPAALAPVIAGISSLHDFFPRHFSHPGAYVKRDLKTGKYTELETLPPLPSFGEGQIATFKPNVNGPSGIQPEFGYVDPNTGYLREMLSPYDVATIYNILPLWNQSTPINGKGVKVAIIGLSDVQTSDFNTFRSSFGLPAGALTTLHSGADPGLTDSQGENTEDVEMVSSTAPGAHVIMVADVSNATTDGLETGINYVIDNEIAPILTMSYGACELTLGTAENSLYNSTFQQAATQGISSFVAAGDSGATVCTPQNGTPPYGDSMGLAVSGMASTPYVTAVGGTDVQWYLTGSTHPYTDYWNTTADAHGATAKGYMPEMAWNDTCSNPLLLNVYTAYTNVEDLCNAALSGSPGLVEMAAGSGGVSRCTTPTGTTPSSCSGGYAKPSWQAGVTGIPADGKRDLPDVSMFAAYGYQSSTGVPGSALLVCQASSSPETSCDYSNPNYIVFQENGGTSAASPLTAGIMALVVQKVGSKQGLANPVFYNLAAKQNYSACNSNTIIAGNACVFNDVTSGSNASVCYTGSPDCVTKTAGDQAGVVSGYNAGKGYDLATGLGTFNVANLVNAWPTGSSAPAVTFSPTSVAFPATLVGTTSAAQVITLKNSGTATLSLTSATVTGTAASSFVKSANTCGSSLAVGASCTVSVEFKPAATGALSAAISIADNVTGTPQTVALTGTGTKRAITLSPTSIAFGSALVGTTSAAHIITLKNSGTAMLTLMSETITGTGASSFVKSANTCGSSLAVGASCTVSVEFKPTAIGALSAAISIADNATGTPQAVALTGSGTKPAVALSPTSIAFSATKVGTTSAAKTVTVKNSGTAILTLNSETLSGTGVTSFIKSATTCGASLAIGASCTISYEFKPTAKAVLTAALSLADNANGSPQKVSLTGTGQ